VIDWRRRTVEALGLLVALATFANVLLGSYVARSVETVQDRAAINQRITILELEIASTKGWEDAHDAKTMPLIAEHQAMVRDWPRAMALLEDIHLFLVRRFQMPSRVPLTPDREPSGGLIAAQPPGAVP
jgi:predicted exporter